MNTSILYLWSVAFAIDTSEIVAKVLSTLTSQASNAVSTDPSLTGSSVDSEQLSQEIEALKAAQASREDATASPSEASPMASSPIASSAPGLQAALKSSLEQMESLRLVFQNLVESFNKTSAGSSPGPSPASDPSSAGIDPSTGFVIEVKMPHQSKAAETITTPAPAEVAVSPSNSIALKIYDPIDDFDEVILERLKHRITNELKTNSNSRVSRAHASELDLSVDEDIRVTALRKAQARDRQKFYEDLAVTYHAEMLAQGKSKLAESIEAESDASLFTNV